jgi:hypothetical protein
MASNLVGRKYHNVIFEVKLFYYILSALLFDCVVRQQVGEHFTRFADLHLLFPTLLYSPFTDGSVYKPAKISGLELPGRTAFLLVGGTFLDRPARFAVLTIFFDHGDQEINLPFHSGRYGSPGLFVAVDSLYNSLLSMGNSVSLLLERKNGMMGDVATMWHVCQSKRFL